MEIIMERIILHSDLNAYFASVECLDRPELQNLPVAVCGSSEMRHGIVLAKNEIAKRCGIKTGESNFSALKKCPGLIMLEPHFDKYLTLSREVRKIYCDYTDRIEPFGIDECWLDVSESTGILGSGKSIAEQIRKRIKRDIGLTVSVGVSFTKTFSKLGSDLKKPDAVTLLPKESYVEKISPLPVSSMLGVGYSTALKLAERGVKTIGQLASLPPSYPKAWLGKNGMGLWLAANGYDTADVAYVNSGSDIKSISNGTTTAYDMKNIESAEATLCALCCEVGFRMRSMGFSSSGIVVGIRYSDFSNKSFREKLPYPIKEDREIFNAASRILRLNLTGEFSLRALTVQAIYLTSNSSPVQLDLFSEMTQTKQFSVISDVCDSLRKKYGKAVLTPALSIYSDAGTHPCCFNMHKTADTD
jgi:DNA polymerase-4